MKKLLFVGAMLMGLGFVTTGTAEAHGPYGYGGGFGGGGYGGYGCAPRVAVAPGGCYRGGCGPVVRPYPAYPVYNNFGYSNFGYNNVYPYGSGFGLTVAKPGFGFSFNNYAPYGW